MCGTARQVEGEAAEADLLGGGVPLEQDRGLLRDPSATVQGVRLGQAGEREVLRFAGLLREPDALRPRPGARSPPRSRPGCGP